VVGDVGAKVSKEVGREEGGDVGDKVGAEGEAVVGSGDGEYDCRDVGAKV